MRPWFSIAALALINAISGLLAPGPTAAQQPPAEAPLVAVTVIPVKREAVADVVERVGRVQAIEDIELRARVEGFLMERRFREGSDVKAGDVLFEIENAPYETAVARAEAQLARAKAEQENARRALNRAEVLSKRGNVSQAALDDAIAANLAAEADVQAAEAELRAAEIDLGYTEITAPVDGRIGRSQYSVGDLVGPDSDVLATLVSLDPIHVYVEVPETVLFDARRRNTEFAEQGGPVPTVTPRIRFRDGSLYEYPGVVDFRDNRVNPTTGTQTARGVFPNPDKALLPGQYVEVVVQIGEETDRLVIPQAAVQEDQAGRFVLVVDDNDQVAVRRVTLGRQKGSSWVAEEGLAEGERVIFQGVQKVRPGMKVDPTVADPATLALDSPKGL